MDQLAVGAIAAGFAAAGLFFLRFWRDTRDRLFAFFAFAFFVLAANRVAGGLLAAPYANYVYWVRLAAFLLILLAILDKNRSRGRAR